MESKFTSHSTHRSLSCPRWNQFIFSHSASLCITDYIQLPNQDTCLQLNPNIFLRTLFPGTLCVSVFFSNTQHDANSLHIYFLVNGKPVSEPAYLKLHRYCWPLVHYLILIVCDSPRGGSTHFLIKVRLYGTYKNFCLINEFGLRAMKWPLI